MTIEQVIRVVFDDSAYTRNVAQAASATSNFDSRVASVTAGLAALTSSADRAGSAQALAANSGSAFLAALEKQGQSLTRQSAVIGKSEADLLRLKAAELGVATQAESTIAALEEQTRSVARLGAGARAVENIRNLAALKSEQAALEAGIAIDLRAGRAKEQLITQIEREAVALTRLAAVPRGSATDRVPTGAAAEQVQVAAAADPDFAARAQPALRNLGAAQAARDQQAFIASLERTANAAGRTRAELLQLEAAQRGVSAQAAPLIARIAAADRQFQSFSKTGRLTALELQQVGFQLNDFFVQVASGGNPFVALIQQGSQLSGTFGGIGAALRAVGSLITATRVAITGAVGAFAVLGIAAFKGAEQSKAFADAILLSGNAAGQTEGRLNSLVATIGRTSTLTQAAAREAAQAVISSGAVGPINFDAATEAVARYAAATKKSADEVARDLTRIAREPAEASADLNRTLNFLSNSQLRQIRTLQDQGLVAQAAAVAYAALNERLRQLDSNLGPLDLLLNKLSKGWDAFWQGAQGIGRAETSLDQLGRLDQRLKELQQTAALGFRFEPPKGPGLLPNIRIGGNQEEIARVEQQRRVLARSIAQAESNATLSAERVQLQREAGAADAVIDGYAKRSKAADEYKRKLEELNRSIAKSEEGVRRDLSLTDAQRAAAISDLQRRATAARAVLTKDFKPSGGGAGDIDRELKRETAAAIEAARRSAQAQVAVIAEQNEELRGQYEAGLIDVSEFYRRRNELAVEAAAAEKARIDAEDAAQRRRLNEGRAADTRQAAADVIETLPDQRKKADADAERAIRKLINDEQSVRIRLDRQIAEIDAEIAQLAGDELAAERQRNQSIVERIRLVSSQRFGDGSQQTQARVQAVEQLLAKQAAFNQLQRDSSLIAERASLAEQAYLISAQARGDTQEEIERGLFAVRQGQLGQLAELARRARELADASTDPRMLVFADQMALAYRRAAEEIDPALAKMRNAVDEAAQAVGDAGGAIVLNFRNAKQAVDALEQSLLRIGTKVLIEEPLTNFARGAFRSVAEGQGGAGEFFRGIFPVGAAGRGFGPSVVDTSVGGTVDVPSSARDALRQLEGSVGGVDKAMVELATSSSASSTVLSLLPQAAAIPATTGMAAVGATAPAAATGLTAVATAATAAAAALSTIGAGSAGAGFFNDLGGLELLGSLGFEGGGYTGDGPASQPAGIVHKGEHVMPQERVAEPGALQFLETVRAVGLDRALSAMPPSPAPMASESAVSSPAAVFGGLSAAPVLGGTIQSSIIERIAASAGDASQIIVGGFTGVGSKFDPAGLVKAGNYVTPMERVREGGALQFLERMREGGLQSALREREARGSLPGFSHGGLVGGYAGGGMVTAALMESLPLAERAVLEAALPSKPEDDGSGRRQITVNVQVTAPPGGSRETALQFGRTVGQQVQIALRRNA